MKDPRVIAAAFVVFVPVLALALCDAGLASTYLGTVCNNKGSDPSYGSQKIENNPVELFHCTTGQSNNKKCVHGTVMLQTKTTNYDTWDCPDGHVIGTTGWVNAGNFAYDSLCTCPS